MGIKEDITKIYIGYYDRAPDPAGLNYWIGRANDGMSLSEIAGSFAVQAESTAKYPYLVNPLVATASEFVTSVYNNLFNRAPDAAGLAYWVAELAGGKAVGQMIIDIMSGATDTSAGNDLTTLNNKVSVGVDFATDASSLGVALDYENNQAAKDAAAAALDSVTDDAATVTAAQAKTDAFVAGSNGGEYAAAKTAYETAAATAVTAATAADTANAAYDTAAAAIASKADAEAAATLADASVDAAATAATDAAAAKTAADAAVAAAAKTPGTADDAEAAALSTAADALVAAAADDVTAAAADKTAADARVTAETTAEAEVAQAVIDLATATTAATTAQTAADDAKTAFETAQTDAAAAKATADATDATALQTAADAAKAISDASTTARVNADADVVAKQALLDAAVAIVPTDTAAINVATANLQVAQAAQTAAAAKETTDLATTDAAQSAADTAVAADTASTNAAAAEAAALADFTTKAADAKTAADAQAAAAADLATKAGATADPADDVTAADAVTTATTAVTAAETSVTAAADANAAVSDAAAEAALVQAEADAQAAYDAAATKASTSASDAAAALAAYNAAAATVSSQAEADTAKGLADAAVAAANTAATDAADAKSLAEAVVTAAAATANGADDVAAAADVVAADAAIAAAATASGNASAAATSAADIAANDFVPQFITLTNGADTGAAFTGRSGNDTFTATESTLSSGDSLDGGKGNGDVLNVSTSGTGTPSLAAFSTVGIENFNITSDATGLGGTTFDMTGATGVSMVSNNNSSRDLTFTGFTNTADLALTNVTGGDTVVGYQTGAVSGAMDAQKLIVNNVHSNAGTAVSGATLNGIEILNVETTGAASLLSSIGGANLQTLNVSGDQNLSVAAVIPNTVANFDASGLTGGAMFDMTFDASGVTFDGKGSDGNDVFKFNATLSANDKVDAGAGDQDTIGFNIIGNVGAGLQLTNFEHASFANATGGTLDMDDLPGINQLFLNNGLNAATSFTDAANGLVVDLNQGTGGFGGQNVTIDHKTDTAADTATLNVDLSTNQTLGTVSLPDAETFTLDIDSNDGLDLLTINNLNGPDLNGSTLNITGDGSLNLVAATATNLGKIEAGTSSGNLDIDVLGGGTKALTINTGSGNDQVTGSTLADTINTGAGNDVVTGSAGADTIDTGAGTDTIMGSVGANTVAGGTEADTFVYAAGSMAATAALSNAASGTDTITDFKSGEDRLNLDGLTLSKITGGAGTALFTQNIAVGDSTFVGNQSSFALAQGALRGGGNSDIVYQADQKILWVDTDGNGTLDNNDFRLVLSTTDTVTAADLGIGLAGVTFTSNKNPFSTAVAADSVEGTVTTNSADIINSTSANLAGSTINGLFGTDTLNITDVHTSGLITTTSVETVNLKMGSSATTSFSAGVTKVTADKTANVNLATSDIAYTGSDEDDIVINVNGADSVDTKGGNDSVTLGTVAITGALDGGANQDTLVFVVGGSDISGSAVSNFEIANITGNATMTSAQHNAFTSIVAAGVGDTATLTTAGTIVANDAIETYSVVEGSNVTVGTSAAGLARVVTETGVAGTVSTLTLGNGTYTGIYTGIENTDIVQVGTATDVSANTGLNGGVVVDFQNAASTGAGLTLNNTQNGLVTVSNTTGAQMITVNGAADTFTALTGIESYSVIGGSSVSIGANTAVNVTTSAIAAASTVNVGGSTATGTYNLQDTGTADVLVATTGANITGVNGGAATTAEVLNLTGNITMSAAQMGGFTSAINATGTADGITLTTSAAHGTIDVDIEAITLNGAGVDTANFTLADNDDGATNAQHSVAVSLAGGGADVITITNATVDATGTTTALAGDHKIINITGFSVADDKISVVETAQTVQTNGVFVNNASSATIGGLTANDGDIIEIDATAFQFGTPANIDAIAAYLDGAGTGGFAFGGALDVVTVVAYNGAGSAAIYQINDAAGGGAFTAGTDLVELVGTVDVVDNGFTGANFI